MRYHHPNPMLTLSSVPAEEAAPFYKDFLAAFRDGPVGNPSSGTGSRPRGALCGLDRIRRDVSIRRRKVDDQGSDRPPPGYGTSLCLSAPSNQPRRCDSDARVRREELRARRPVQSAQRERAGFRVHAAAIKYVGTREWRPFSRVASHRDCEWLPHERSRTCLHHSWAYRTSLSAEVKPCYPANSSAEFATRSRCPVLDSLEWLGRTKMQFFPFFHGRLRQMGAPAVAPEHI
jgi:hypothetical protein